MNESLSQRHRLTDTMSQQENTRASGRKWWPTRSFHLVSLTFALLLATTKMSTSQSDQELHSAREVKIKTQVPVIGVLTQVLRDYKRFTDRRHLHLAASYAKWIESAGAQVLPILLNQDDEYYARVFAQTNGLLFPGGDNLLDPLKATPMMVASRKLYRLALEANERGDFYPIWGTCLGMELLSVLGNELNTLVDCSANDIALPVKLTQRGNLFKPSNYPNTPASMDYAGMVASSLEHGNLTYNFHHKCITDDSLKRAKLDHFYRPLAYSADKQGKTFIAIMEAVDFPFYGVQFHPEKPPFEFVVKKSQLEIPHSREAIAVSRYFADFFVTLAQQNGHRGNQASGLACELVYAYDPTYTATKNDMYEQRYLFPYQSMDSVSDDEFLDYLPDDDEDPCEDVTVVEEGEQAAELLRKFKSSDYVQSSHYDNLTRILTEVIKSASKAPE